MTSMQAERNEKAAAHEVSSVDLVESAGWDKSATKRLIRKIDLRLIPFLSLLYLLSFLDRTNIGNARLDTLEDDLNMPKTSLQYNNALGKSQIR